MTDLDRIAPEFVAMAHAIVWASVATVGPDGRPRTRILHPIWEWDGTDLVGWIATSPTPLKESHLAAHPDVAVSYWTTTHDTCSADCAVEWVLDDDRRTRVWQLFENGPEPVGYDPAIIEPWRDGPTSAAFAAWRLTPYRLRVMPGTVMTQGERHRLLTWSANA
ncbi:pyridoxamine 5'-phosphate oxidase family protein [Mycobacterium sp. NPDC050041]|uniref:pyridoxamine 5'-phosphate oxidase family protein n=1 Tax=Mycobacterium sp. NPDC050041 TaxID=3364293 RepID=UPI003C2F214D